MQSRYAKDVKQIIKALEEPEENQSLPDEEALHQEVLPQEATHAYPVNIGGVQGVLFTKEEVSPEYFTKTAVDEREQEPPEVTRKQPTRAKKEPLYFLYYVLILCLFLVLDNVNSVLTSLFTSTATITIVTSSHEFSTNTVFTIPTSSFRQVSFTETGSVPTTGKGHQNATFARGEVTFYNSLPSPQTIDTGTLLAASDGVQFVIDEAITVPAGSYSGNGQVSVSAHAISPGLAGNIQAGDISGTCCKEYILVRNNAAFSGGQGARDFQFVTSTDMQDVQNSLFSKINGELQKDQSQVPSSDTLLTPVPCSNNIQSNHRVGDEATSLTVSINQICSIVSYSQKVFQNKLASEVLNRIEDQFGTGYTLLQAPTTRITNTKIQIFQLTFFATSTAIYRLNFSSSRTNALSNQIAGQSKQNALQVLKRETGVNSISLALTNSDTSLPTDTTNIRFVVIYQQS